MKSIRIVLASAGVGIAVALAACEKKKEAPKPQPAQQPAPSPAPQPAPTPTAEPAPKPTAEPAPGPATPADHKAVTTDTLEPYECGAITRLHTYQGLFLASQPKADDFTQARNSGVKSVINLRHEDEVKDFDEPAIVKGLGLAYLNIPFASPGELTDDTFGKALDAFRTVERPALVHCSSANRVGAIWVAYRAIDGKLPVEEAVAEAKVVGLTSPDFEKIAREYVQKHMNDAK